MGYYDDHGDFHDYPAPPREPQEACDGACWCGWTCRQPLVMKGPAKTLAGNPDGSPHTCDHPYHPPPQDATTAGAFEEWWAAANRTFYRYDGTEEFKLDVRAAFDAGLAAGERRIGDRMVEQRERATALLNERDRAYESLRAENERLDRLTLEWANKYRDLSAENERLRESARHWIDERAAAYRARDAAEKRAEDAERRERELREAAAEAKEFIYMSFHLSGACLVKGTTCGCGRDRILGTLAALARGDGAGEK